MSAKFNPERIELLQSGMKRCSKCNIVKPTEEFNKNKNDSTGFHSHCKDCARLYNSTHLKEAAERAQKYYHKNEEKCRDARMDYYARNRDLEISRHKQWMLENKEQQKIYNQKYHENNPNWAKEYRQKNLERMKIRDKIYSIGYRREHYQELLSRNRARRSLKKANGGDLTYEQWVQVCNKYENKCLCCGTSERMSLDHIIPITKGGKHIAENVQPLCCSCNSRKGTKIIDYRPKEELCLSVIE